MGHSSQDLSSNKTINGHFPADPEPEKTKEKEDADVERQSPSQPQTTEKKSVYQSLGWLDRLLALWILLAIIVGILLGNYVDTVGPALQRGKFVQVSVPIGMWTRLELRMAFVLTCHSCRTSRDDVSHIMQNQVRDSPSRFCTSSDMDPDWIQHYSQLDCGTPLHGKSSIHYRSANALHPYNHDLELSTNLQLTGLAACSSLGIPAR
jgi:hypothetical protein